MGNCVHHLQMYGHGVYRDVDACQPDFFIQGQEKGNHCMKVFRGFGFFITTNLIYLVVPLLGWGLTDLRGFFSLPQRVVYALIIEVLGLAVGIQAVRSPEGIRGGKGRDDTRVPRQRIIRNFIILMLYAALWFLPFADRRGIAALSNEQFLRWLGTILFVIGMWLIYWSGVVLGRLYSGDVTLQEEHHLVTDGPYRYARHPRYTGGILLAFGMTLIYNSWIGLPLSVLFIGVILVRIHDEEIMMAQAFGQKWVDYCQRTHRLIPFVY